MIFKFRIFCLTLLALSFISVPAWAQQAAGYVEYQHTFNSGDSTPQINIYAHGPIKGKFGWTVWTLTTQPWSEALIGLTYAPAEWIEVSASVGLETNDNPLRYAGNVWLGKGRFSLLSLIEDGGSGKWHKHVATFKTTPTTAIGILNQRYVGTGPYAEARIGKATVWGSWVGGKSGLVGLRFNF